MTKFTIGTLKDQNKHLILITRSPSIWQKKVFNCFGLNTYFDEVYSGDRSDNKRPRFAEVTQRHNPAKTLSIGDTPEEDGVTAVQAGMMAYILNDTNDFENLLHFFTQLPTHL